MKRNNLFISSLLLMLCLPMIWSNSVMAAPAHDGDFNVEVGDQYEFVWSSLKDSEGNAITDASWSYPDANDSQISEGDNFYLDVAVINSSVMGPTVYGNFTFADGSTTGTVALMGYFKAMNSTSYNWTYWYDYYTDKNYTVTNTTEYFEYNTGNETHPGMRFRWDAVDGAMLEWELYQPWIQMMGFGTLSHILIERYESVTDYGVNVGDKIWLKWDVLIDADLNPITDGSYSYPDAPTSNISQGDVFYIEITTMNSSFMGASVYGKFVFGDVSSNETMLMGYVKSMEWNHYQLYYTYKGYTVTNTATQFGYQSGSLMGGPLLKMIWGRTTGSVEEFHLKGYWINMMGFGTPSEIKLVATTDPTITTTTTTVPVVETTTTTEEETSAGTSGFEAMFLILSLAGLVVVTRRRK